ncbi:MAG: flagellar motor protein MotD [Burkholderiales bacterium]|nr:flagellar motor protein MotD [Burkholderiales bacterium]
MVRRRQEDEHENHDRWLVSYADFITLLFAFFVVMYAISQVNEGKYRVLSDALLHAFKPDDRGGRPYPDVRRDDQPQPAIQLPIKLPVDAGRRRVEAKMKGIADDIRKVLEPLVKEGQVRVTESARGIAVEINASVLFAPGQAVLNDSSVRSLVAVAQVLAGAENAIEVEGHTDNAPIGTPLFPSNWELSAARASRVVRLFTQAGVAPERMAAIGYGEYRNVDTNDTPEGKARNRRVTVMILPAGESNPPAAAADVPVATP